MRLTLYAACAAKFNNKTQIASPMRRDKCQGGCKRKVMCLAWDVEIGGSKDGRLDKRGY